MSSPVVTTPTFQLFEPLEQITIFTPLGIRFWDAALDRQVTDGLVVTARRPGSNQRPVRAFRTRSGIYAFRGLPGLRAIEYPVDDADRLGGSPPALTGFFVEVVDEERRFVPTVFTVDVPFEGIYPTGSSDPMAPPGVYLFSAPTRPVASSLAVVRAQLAERPAGGEEQPAAFALLEVEVAGRPPAFGIADELGNVAVQFPYPRFSTALPNGSPPASADGSASQRWPIRVRVRFDPPALDVPIGSSIPTLRSIFSQRPGAIQAGSGPAPEFATELAAGRQVVLRHSPGSTFVISRAI
ncbi:MAG TPA: hypothetical protein VFV93_10815 [Thermomicrobiales bacterium]|nr:hypothetical protein [Thermomicrobiales bacterium]